MHSKKYELFFLKNELKDNDWRLVDDDNEDLEYEDDDLYEDDDYDYDYYRDKDNNGSWGDWEDYEDLNEE